MKKFIIGFLLGAMIFGIAGYAVTYVAQPATFKVMVNGEEFISDPPVLVIEGSTYLPLRAMGDALGVPVEWNAELKQAEVGNSNDTKEQIEKLYSWLVGDIWNDGICEMSHYYYDGTGSTGEILDVDFTLERFEKAYAKKSQFDKQVTALPDSYSELKSVYSKLSDEIDVLYTEIKKRGKTTPSKGFDTGKYTQYADVLYDYLSEIIYN